MPYFPEFSESIRQKYCYYWNKVNENDNCIENIFTDENSLNVYGLLDITATKVCNWGSGALMDGKGSKCRPNHYVKQSSIYDGHYKFHSLSALTISFPNSMSTLAGIVSARKMDYTILTWSKLDDFLHNLCISNNMPDYSFYVDKGFSGT